MPRGIIQLGLLGLLALTLGMTPQVKDSEANLLLTQTPLTIDLPDLELNVTSYPQALPNDGFSQSTITVALTSQGEPVSGRMIQAKVVLGDGTLTETSVTTDDMGFARLTYRAGLIPETAEINIVAEELEAQAAVTIPLAAVTYLDLTLVTPEEYMAYMERQVSAAPIYTMTVDAFPQQLAADGGSLAKLSARLNLTEDGTPAAGVPLSVEIISGEGDLAVDEIATDDNGQFTFFYMAGFTPGTVTVQVTEPATGLVENIDILLVESGPARVELYCYDRFSPDPVRDGAMLPADGFTAMPMVAEVTDLTGIPLNGVEVKLEILDIQNGWIEVLDPVTDAAGQIEFTYYAGSMTGPVRLRAYIADGLEFQK